MYYLLMKKELMNYKVMDLLKWIKIPLFGNDDGKVFVVLVVEHLNFSLTHSHPFSIFVQEEHPPIHHHTTQRLIELLTTSSSG